MTIFNFFKCHVCLLIINLPKKTQHRLFLNEYFLKLRLFNFQNRDLVSEAMDLNDKN